MAQGKVVDVRALYQVGRAMSPEGGMKEPNRTMDMFMNMAGSLAVNWLWDSFQQVKSLKQKNTEDAVELVTTQNMEGPVADMVLEKSQAWSDELASLTWKDKFTFNKKKKTDIATEKAKITMNRKKLYEFTSSIAQDKNKIGGIYSTGKYVTSNGETVEGEMSAFNPAETQQFWANFATGNMEQALHFDENSGTGGLILSPGDPINNFYSDKVQKISIPVPKDQLEIYAKEYKTNIKEGREVDDIGINWEEGTMEVDFLPYNEFKKPILKQVGKFQKLYDNATESATKLGSKAGWSPVVEKEVTRLIHNAFNGSEKLTGDEINSAYFDGAFTSTDASGAITMENPALRFITNPPEGATLPTMDDDPKSDTYGQVIRKPFYGFNENQVIDETTREYIEKGFEKEKAIELAIGDAAKTKQGYMEALKRENLDTPFYRKFLQNDLVNHSKEIVQWSNQITEDNKVSNKNKNKNTRDTQMIGGKWVEKTDVAHHVDLLNSDEENIPAQPVTWVGSATDPNGQWRRVNGQNQIWDGDTWVIQPNIGKQISLGPQQGINEKKSDLPVVEKEDTKEDAKEEKKKPPSFEMQTAESGTTSVALPPKIEKLETPK